MRQSNLIFGCLFLAFIVFITMRGELPKYLAALIGTNKAASSSNSNSNEGGSTSSGGASGQDKSIASGGLGGIVSSIDRATQIPGLPSLGPASLGQNILNNFSAGGMY